MHLYREELSDHKANAQRNLAGRTHYVDDDTLRFHKSKVLRSYVVDHGLLFAIITCDGLDYQNTRRGFRFVVFDVFGNVVARTKLEDAYRRREQAEKAMWAALNGLDAKQITLAAATQAETNYASELAQLRTTVDAVAAKE